MNQKEVVNMAKQVLSFNKLLQMDMTPFSGFANSIRSIINVGSLCY